MGDVLSVDDTKKLAALMREAMHDAKMGRTITKVNVEYWTAKVAKFFREVDSK